MKYRRIFAIVIDSFGIGAMDNAAEYGDTGCDTFGHIADKVPEIKIPNLIRMGLTQLHPAPVLTSPQPSDRIGKYARLNEKSNGKEQCRKGNSKKGNGSEKRNHQNDGAACPFWGQYSG